MELRNKQASVITILAALYFGTPLLAQRELRFDVRHDHSLKSCVGTLLITEQAIFFQEVNKGEKEKDLHSWQWNYADVEQLSISPERLVVLTYKDGKWLLGKDKEYEFTPSGDQTFTSVYDFLKVRLDQRFVAAVADEDVKAVWQVPVKQLGRIRGSEGMLIIGEDRIVYKTDAGGKSRSWRYSDIENIGTSGPFQLTVTTFERAKFHYGDLKGFNFQLKQRLDENSYNDLWRRINASKGLKFLNQSDERRANL